MSLGGTLRGSLAALLLAYAAPAISSSSTAGSISNITPNAAGRVFFQHSGTHTARPSCATLDRWVIDTTTAGGQALLSALLTAYSTGKQIQIDGTGNCSAWGDTETVDRFVIIG